MSIQAVESYSVCFCKISPKAGILLFVFILKEVLWQLIYPNSCIRLIYVKTVISLLMTSHKYTQRQSNVCLFD